MNITIAFHHTSATTTDSVSRMRAKLCYNKMRSLENVVREGLNKAVSKELTATNSVGVLLETSSFHLKKSLLKIKS